MRYNLYCDESSTTGARYMLIGGLWVPWEAEPAVRLALSEVRARHNLRAEMKWTKVSLGFYKFYFQLVSRNLTPGNLYWLFTDERKNRKPYRLAVLKLTVNRWWRRRANVEPLRNVEPRRSHDEDLTQLTDVLLGAIAYAWNERTGSATKLSLTSHIAQRLGWPTLRVATRPTAPKVNIWKWQPSGS